MPAPNEGNKNLPRSLDGLSHSAGWDETNQRYMEFRTDQYGNTTVIPVKGIRTHFNKNPGTTNPATLLLAANPLRKEARIVFVGTALVYVGKTPDVTITDGTPYEQGDKIDDLNGTDAWYGIVAVGDLGTRDVRGWEIA